MEEAYDEIMKLISQIPEAKAVRDRAVLMKQLREQFLFYVGEANSAIEDRQLLDNEVECLLDEDDEF
jgi:hypothetical protein